jgi:hypothetical protein
METCRNACRTSQVTTLRHSLASIKHVKALLAGMNEHCFQPSTQVQPLNAPFGFNLKICMRCRNLACSSGDIVWKWTNPFLGWHLSTGENEEMQFLAVESCCEEQVCQMTAWRLSVAGQSLNYSMGRGSNVYGGMLLSALVSVKLCCDSS